MRKLRESKPGIEKKETLTSALWAPWLTYGESELYKRNKELDKNRIKEKRAKQNGKEIEAENLEARIRMRQKRENQTNEERTTEKLETKMRVREIRKKNRQMRK